MKHFFTSVRGLVLTGSLVLLVGAAIACFFSDSSVLQEIDKTELLLKQLVQSPDLSECKVNTYASPVTHYYECKVNNKFLLILDETETITGKSMKTTHLRIWDDKGILLIMETGDSDGRVQSEEFIKAVEYFKENITKCSEQ